MTSPITDHAEQAQNIVFEYATVDGDLVALQDRITSALQSVADAAAEARQIQIVAYLSYDTVYSDDFCVRCSHCPSNCECAAPVYMSGFEPGDKLKALKVALFQEDHSRDAAIRAADDELATAERTIELLRGTVAEMQAREKVIAKAADAAVLAERKRLLQFLTEAVEQLGAEEGAALTIGHLQSELGMTTPFEEVRKRLRAKLAAIDGEKEKDESR